MALCHPAALVPESRAEPPQAASVTDVCSHQGLPCCEHSSLYLISSGTMGLGILGTQAVLRISKTLSLKGHSNALCLGKQQKSLNSHP